jgi:hypothetical protein
MGPFIYLYRPHVLLKKYHVFTDLILQEIICNYFKISFAFILKIVVADASETLITIYHNIWYHIQEDHNTNKFRSTHRRDNLKTHLAYYFQIWFLHPWRYTPCGVDLRNWAKCFIVRKK